MADLADGERITLTEQASWRCDQAGLSLPAAWCEYDLAWCSLAAGDGAAGLRFMNRALARTPLREGAHYTGGFLGTLAVAHAMLGD
ncbi:MAG TPA: hypothetical protein VGJ14_04530, partial [Sporichthyaceae bacterium]